MTGEDMRCGPVARFPFLLVATLAVALAPGCASTEVAPDPPTSVLPGPDEPLPELPTEDEVEAMASLDLHVEADTARVQVPERFRHAVVRPEPGSSPPWVVRLRSVVVVVREVFPVVEVGGDDFWISAEGIVKTVRRSDDFTLREGPFQTLLLRNGQLLRR